MGKTLVARGVIAGAIERLQHDDSVDRIDIIYICSNADIARQNIAKLDVRGDGTKPLSTRITMLATQLRDLNRRMPDGSKTVNLVAFTPGTSFDKGHRSGRVEERALLAWLLRTDRRRHAAPSATPCSASSGWTSTRTAGTGSATASTNPTALPDADSREKFRTRRPAHARHGRPARLHRRDARPLPVQRRADPAAARHRRRALRRILAEVSVDCLEPDLVILDEFQRFKHLLERPRGRRRARSQPARPRPLHLRATSRCCCSQRRRTRCTRSPRSAS